MQDIPIVEQYRKIDIENNGETITIYYYNENGKCYIE